MLATHTGLRTAALVLTLVLAVLHLLGLRHLVGRSLDQFFTFQTHPNCFLAISNRQFIEPLFLRAHGVARERQTALRQLVFHLKQRIVLGKHLAPIALFAHGGCLIRRLALGQQELFAVDKRVVGFDERRHLGRWEEVV